MPTMTPGKQPQISTSVCFPQTWYPGGQTLGVTLLVLVLAFQRFIVPLDTGSIAGPVFSGCKYNVRQLAQVLFPWTVRKQRPTPKMSGGRCLQGWPRVLVRKIQKLNRCYVILYFTKDEKSFIYRHIFDILLSVCYSLSPDGNPQLRS